MYLEYLQPKFNVMDESNTRKKSFPGYSPNLTTPITSNFNEETGSDYSLITPRRISGSNSNSNSNSNSGSIDENEPTHSNSSSSSARQIRKKWKEPEDIAFITTIMNNSQLLTFVEYFKPMKNFWKKISKILFQQYGYERNSRQCHDRFKVLYSKSLKVHPSKKIKQKKKKSKQETDSNFNIDAPKLSRMQFLLLQLQNTFSFVNGNIILKSQKTLRPAKNTTNDNNNNVNNNRNNHINNNNNNNINNNNNNNSTNVLSTPEHIRSSMNIDKLESVPDLDAKVEPSFISPIQFSLLSSAPTDNLILQTPPSPFFQQTMPLQLPRDPQQQEQISSVLTTDMIYMWQTMFNTIENLKEQVNDLKNEVKQLNRKFYQQNKPLQNFSTSNSDSFMQQH
ncbi:Rpi1p [Saccharomyces eubayanus]|uniref:Rpi1p n=1 Tax=Saccharomyces eubayanus TaxID=1080349 RepID=UPI0006C3C344|nr:RPI1-like protein [Saccharomyces eubayanus]KOG98785.1 RPI1-like protein [Saccharomyces eubayanus]